MIIIIDYFMFDIFEVVGVLSPKVLDHHKARALRFIVVPYFYIG